MHRVKETGTCICFIALKLLLLRLLSPDGGIGRRAGLKHLWETVPVRLRLRVRKTSSKEGVFLFINSSNDAETLGVKLFQVRLRLQVRKTAAKEGVFNYKTNPASFKAVPEEFLKQLK